MKIEYHLTLKNGLAIIIGVCVLGLAVIPLNVAPEHLSWLRWELAVLVLAIVAVVGLFYQAHLQSRDDQEQVERNKRIEESLGSLASRNKQREAAASSNALMRGVSYPPGEFNSKEFFRTAYYSSLQDVAANSFREEAKRVRPEDAESFYLDVLTVGSMVQLYDDMWWRIYKSQLVALLAMNKNNGIASLASLKELYDAANKKLAAKYKEFGVSFDKWLEYLTACKLVTVHPNETVEITLKGKDFLKYLLHWGRSEELKLM